MAAITCRFCGLKQALPDALDPRRSRCHDCGEFLAAAPEPLTPAAHGATPTPAPRPARPRGAKPRAVPPPARPKIPTAAQVAFPSSLEAKSAPQPQVWYLLQGDPPTPGGPYDSALVAGWIREGRVGPDNWLSRDGQDWRQGRELPDLFAGRAASARGRARRGHGARGGGGRGVAAAVGRTRQRLDHALEREADTVAADASAFQPLLAVAWGINILAWVVFVATSSRILDVVMGILCLACAYMAWRLRSTWLLIVSVADAAWMFAWALDVFGAYAASESLERLFG